MKVYVVKDESGEIVAVNRNSRKAVIMCLNLLDDECDLHSCRTVDLQLQEELSRDLRQDGFIEVMSRESTASVEAFEVN